MFSLLLPRMSGKAAKQFCRLASHTLFSVALLLPLSATANITTLPETLSKELERQKIDPNALSLVSIPLTNKKAQPRFYNADVPVNPASTMKLVTTYSALELLGPSFQWKTEFFTDGEVNNGVLTGNLYVKGGGDPKLNMEKLWLLLRDLRANGVKHIKGDLILDRSHFVLPQLEAFDDDGEDQNKPYLVEPDSLLINFKAMRIIVRAEASGVKIVTEPPVKNLRIENYVTLEPKGKCVYPDKLTYTSFDTGSNSTLAVSGNLAEGCSAQKYMALLDHPSYAADVIRNIWEEMGGTISGKNRLEDVPKDATLLTRSYSSDLTEVIRDINKYSNNTMAKQVFLSMGRYYRTPNDADDAAAARRVLAKWLVDKKIVAKHLVIENGSGLSRKEQITAREMAAFLQAAWQSPYAAEFISSLPIVAMDGTMRNRLKNTGIRGQAHIKTGTLRNVRAVAGFVRDNQGDAWAIVAIINHDQPWGGAEVLDKALLELYENPELK